MNTDTKSKLTVEQSHALFLKLISKSASAMLGVALMAIGFLVAVPCVQAQTTISVTDTNFILAAAQGGMTEVQLGELAATNGLRADVKAFGQKMVKDHTAINDDLKALAAQKGVSLPDSLDATNQKMVDKLTALTGSDFDDAYISGMFKGHKQAIKAFKAESAETKDADVKSFTDKSIPVLKEHLKLITAIKKSQSSVR